jgi:hypothetical protein
VAKDHKIDIHAKDEHCWSLLFFAAENSNKKLTPLMPLAILVARMASTAELRHAHKK